MYRLLARLMGWTIGRDHVPEDVRRVLDRCVVVAAPHTSNWDAFFMLLASRILKVRFRYGIKQEWLKSPLAPLLKRLGAIGIDRKPRKEGEQRPSLVQAMVQLFKDHDQLALALAPEGTRQYRAKWKTGFYQVALEAGVPIVLSRLDYRHKIATVDKLIHPTGDMEADFREIMAHFATVTPRHPERFCLDVTRCEVPALPPVETDEEEPDQTLKLEPESPNQL